MRTGLIICAIAAVCVAATFATADNRILSWPFSAPVVSNTGAVVTPALGNILYDNSIGAYRGWDGSSWTVFGGAGATSLNVSTINSSAAISVSDDLILVDASSAGITVTLPTANGSTGKVFTIKKIDNSWANAVTVDADGSETIDGMTTTSLNTTNETIKIASDGSDWEILERRTSSGWISGGTNTITSTGGSAAKGTTSVDVVWYRRVGANLEVRIEYRQTAAGTAGSGDYLFTVPASLSIDTTKLNAYSTVEGWASNFNGNNIVGQSGVFNGTNNAIGVVSVYDATHVRLFGNDTTNNSGAPAGGGTGYGFERTTLHYLAAYSVPISGWNE